MKKKKLIMVFDGRFLASLEMTAKQLERKSVNLLRLRRRRLTLPVPHTQRVIPNAVRNPLKLLPLYF